MLATERHNDRGPGDPSASTEGAAIATDTTEAAQSTNGYGFVRGAPYIRMVAPNRIAPRSQTVGS